MYSFKGGSDGALPLASLINVGGNLYGTTESGGASGLGTVFKVTGDGREKILYSFGGGSDGGNPYAGLINVDGRLYGTTYLGGSGRQCSGGKSDGCGTVFAVKFSGTEKVVYSFGSSIGDGAIPYPGLVNVGGILYGTTAFSGTSNQGTLFNVSPAGVETVLYSFQGANDGDYPNASLIHVGTTLYGTTSAGGGTRCQRVGCGTVFKLTKARTEKVVHSFGSSSDGTLPYAGLLNVGGTLFGTTEFGGSSSNCTNGCGTVFEVTKTGAERVVYSFEGEPDGAGPVAGLINVNGKLYGTTVSGGSGSNCTNGCGTVFEVTKAGAERIVYSFGSGSDGVNPSAALINVGGTLYGSTASGGTSNQGTVFAVMP